MYYFKVFSHDEDTVATSVELKFLHYICGYWEFPKVDDIKIVDTKYVYMEPCTPVEIRRGFKFNEDEEALKKYRALKMI